MTYTEFEQILIGAAPLPPGRVLLTLEEAAFRALSHDQRNALGEHQLIGQWFRLSDRSYVHVGVFWASVGAVVARLEQGRPAPAGVWDEPEPDISSLRGTGGDGEDSLAGRRGR